MKILFTFDRNLVYKDCAKKFYQYTTDLAFERHFHSIKMIAEPGYGYVRTLSRDIDSVPNSVAVTVGNRGE